MNAALMMVGLVALVGASSRRQGSMAIPAPSRGLTLSGEGMRVRGSRGKAQPVSDAVRREARELVALVDQAAQIATDEGVDDLDTLEISNFVDDPRLIGAGADRIVFRSRVDPSLVIKITTVFRRSTNRDEADAWRGAGPRARRLLVPVLDADWEGSWLVMPHVRRWDEATQGPLDPSALQSLGLLDVREENVDAQGRALDYAEPIELEEPI